MEYKAPVLKQSDPFDIDEINIQLKAYKYIRDNTNYIGARDIHWAVWANYYTGMDLEGMIEYLEGLKESVERLNDK